MKCPVCKGVYADYPCDLCLDSGRISEKEIMFLYSKHKVLTKEFHGYQQLSADLRVRVLELEQELRIKQKEMMK